MTGIKTTAPVGLLVGLLTTYALAAEPAPTTAPAPKYDDPRYGFSISPPAFSVADGTAIIATFFAPPSGGFSANVNVLVQPGATTRARYIQDTKDGLKQIDGQVNAVTNVQVSGHDAVVIDYEGSSAGRHLRFLALAVVMPDRVYLTTCTTPAEDWPKHEREFRACLDTFKLAQ